MHLLLLVLLLVCAARARHEFSFENGEEHVAAVHPRGYPFLPQSTTPIALPAPAPREPGQPHPPSHVRVVTTPLRD